jgi:hypothetical protein
MADGVELSPKSLADLRQLGDAYKGADKALQKRLRTGLQAAGKPLAEQVIREGSADLPARGGLRARIAASRPGITAALAGRNVSVSVRIVNKQKDALGAYDSGTLRHPVFKTGRWVAQGIPADRFVEAFRRGAPEATDRVNAEIGKALSEIAADAD